MASNNAPRPPDGAGVTAGLALAATGAIVAVGVGVDVGAATTAFAGRSQDVVPSAL